MSVYDRVASTEPGRRGLASARLRRQSLKALHAALATSGMTKSDLARKLGIRKSAVGSVFGGDGNVRVNTLAEYLDAMGAELRVEVVPAGTLRRETRPVSAATTGVIWRDLATSISVSAGRKSSAAVSTRTDFARAA